MMDFDRRQACFKKILGKVSQSPVPTGWKGHGFAPSNIALVKYWGKRDEALNLPNAPSVSLSLKGYGANTQIGVLPKGSGLDEVILNGTAVSPDTHFFKRLQAYLDEVRVHTGVFYQVQIESAVPIKAGVASSAAGFAALVLALNALHAWDLPYSDCAILARLGSGSATRSLCPGFVVWPHGEHPDGSDSFGQALDPKAQWPELRMGLLLWSTQEKAISSREGMKRTQKSSPFYGAWPALAERDTSDLIQAIRVRDFEQLGHITECNAMALHALIRSARPAFFYDLPQTLEAQKRVQWLRETHNVRCYFTQDAGPNLKLLFHEADEAILREYFPEIQVIPVF